MSTKGHGQNRFGDFRFPRAGGLMHVSLLYAVSDGPSRALVVRLHAVIPPVGVQPPRHTRGARHGTHSPADGSFKPLRFGTRPLPRCRLLSLKSSSALSRVGLRGRAPHGGPQSPNPSRRAPRAAEPCAPFRNCVGNAPFARIGFCVEEAQGAFSRGRKCFRPAFIGGGRKIGIGCHEKIGIRVLQNPPCGVGRQMLYYALVFRAREGRVAVAVRKRTTIPVCPDRGAKAD